ncbi:MAG TPA: Na+:solute symporter, partial [Bacteroidota bacterium]|nr:Na+:solute symporter [Bacteroidota bacterium]
FLASVIFLILNKNGIHVSTHIALLGTIAFTTVCWISTAFLGPETDRQTLIDFYKKIRPFGPGWKQIREEAGLPVNDANTARGNIPLSLLGWGAGCAMIWSALFTVGNFLYGRMGYAFVLLGVFVISGSILIYAFNIIWSGSDGNQERIPNE